jgi:hypothetical protein
LSRPVADVTAGGAGGVVTGGGVVGGGGVVVVGGGVVVVGRGKAVTVKEAPARATPDLLTTAIEIV